MRVAIVGAGAGGLSAAFDLAGAGAQVTVFEAADQVGGLAAGFRLPRWEWSVEQFYHHWFASDADVLRLAEELGVRARVTFPWPMTAAYHQGGFYVLDGPLTAAIPGPRVLDRLPGAGLLARGLHALRFPALSLADTLRYGRMGLYLTRTANWRPLEAFRAHEWLLQRSGAHGYQVLWQPLLEGKFGPHYRDVNMAWFWARVKARTPRLGTFEGGFQAFLDVLAERVQARGVQVRLRTPIQRIDPLPDGRLELQVAGGAEVFEHCLVTTSPGLLARLAPGLPEEYLRGLLALRSMGSISLVLALRQRLSTEGFYWHNLPKSAGFPFLALVEHTNFVSPARFGGDHIVYCGDYLDPDHESFSLSKDALLERFLPALSRFNPAFEPSWVRDSWLFRTPYAQPVPGLYHSRNIPPLETPLRGLWFASMSQVYPWDRGTNFAIRIARQAAARIVADKRRAAA
jgi:protoporphyrinogen oxidase